MIVEPMRIPVFVSCPSDLNPAQEKSAQIIKRMLTRNKLAWRALGRSDYSYKLPLREVLGMMRHCSGGLVLGFKQFEAPSYIVKAGTKSEDRVDEPLFMPTPWNHLEAGVMFNLRVPILVFREEGISGGVFDVGTDDVFLHKMPSAPLSTQATDELETLFQNWASDVKTHYYGR